MRLFHELMMDTNLDGPTGANPIWSKFYWGPVLGQVEALRFMVLADRIAGTSLNLTLDLLDSPDGGVRVNLIKNLLSVVPIAGQANLYQGALSTSDTGSVALYGYYFRCAFSGSTSPKAHVRVWVTGRGKA